MKTRNEALGAALELLKDHTWLAGAGIACHGPMAAEALSFLGFDDAVEKWVEAYGSRFPPVAPPPRIERIDGASEASVRGALGKLARVSDWDALFAAELREGPWADVVRRWVPRLLPGYAGGLTHGLLRVGHVVRALEDGSAPADLGLRELARGLAFWAAFYAPVAATAKPSGDLDARRAVAAIPRPDLPWRPLEAATFSRLDELRAFPAAIAALRPPIDVGEAFSDLTAAFCRVILESPSVELHWLVHTVTPVVAIRTLLPYAPEVRAEDAFAEVWRVSAALVAGFAHAAPPAEPALDDVPSEGEIAARAADHGDFHVIKLAAACIAEHRRRPDPVYLLAAQQLVDRTPVW